MGQDELTWRLLGSDTAEGPEGSIGLAARPRGVLLTLLTRPNEIVARDQLAEALWGEAQPKAAANAIARFVADLRRSLGSHRERIQTTAGGYRIEVRSGELDLDRVRSALAEAIELAEQDPESAGAAAAAGLSEFRVEPNRDLADLHGVAWVVREIKEIQVALQELAADLQLRQGGHRELIPTLEAAVLTFPYHERFWAQLMVALYRSGRQTAALDAYQRLRVALQDLGLEPSPTIQAIEAEVLAHEGPSLLVDEPTAGMPRALAAEYGIAEPRTSFVGREAELRELDAAITGHRLVSIVGLGGSGKTRLALEAARTRDPDQVVYRVGLRPLTDPGLVLPAIAAVIGLTPDKAADPVSLATRMSGQRFLLVVDNVEHVLDACREVVEAILDHTAGGRILITSRLPLSTEGEHVLRLAPLAVPPAEAVSETHAAVALFLERAREHTELVADADALLDIGAICRLLGGLPIAIELAAAQLAYLSPADLVDHLSEPLGPGPPDADAPQARVASVLDWCWSTLTPREQDVLARLSVLGDRWTLASAEAVCGGAGPVLEPLARLVDKSLVARIVGTGRARYEMLESVRDHAAGRLVERGDTDDTADRLVDWLQELTRRWSIAELYSWADAIDTLEPEHHNLLAGLEHLRVRGRTETLLWLAVRAAGMWTQRGFPGETSRWLEPLVDDPTLPAEARSAAAAALMDAASTMADHLGLVRWGTRSLELADGHPYDWVPHVAGVLAVTGLIFVVPTSSDELSELSVIAARNSASAATNLGLAAVWRGHVEFGRRNYAAALVQFRVARAHCREPGRILLFSEMGEGLALYMLGRLDPERREEAVAVAAAWRSDPATDEWHYLIDVARAIVDGGGGRHEQARTALSAAVRERPPGTVWSRADDYQTAFALLADFRGEHELADELLATPLPGNPLIATIVIEHEALKRGRDDEAGWLLTAAELISRAVPDDPVGARDITAAIPVLVEWWAAGDDAVRPS